MGLSHEQHAKRLANLNPQIEQKPAEPVIEVDRSGFMDPDTRRGIPVFDGKYGLPGGSAIKDTRPGGELGAAKRLEQAGRDIVQGHLKRTRRKDHQ